MWAGLGYLQLHVNARRFHSILKDKTNFSGAAIKNKLLRLRGKVEIDGKARQNAENKQTFDLTRTIEIEERKTRQNAENKQTFDVMRKIQIDEKTRQNAENKQTFDLKGEN